MDPENMLDEHGGLIIPNPPKHVCDLPYAGIVDCLAYRSGCCNTWYRRVFGEYDYYWKPMSNWRIKRWRKKGWLPS